MGSPRENIRICFLYWGVRGKYKTILLYLRSQIIKYCFLFFVYNLQDYFKVCVYACVVLSVVDDFAKQKTTHTTYIFVCLPAYFLHKSLHTSHLSLYLDEHKHGKSFKTVHFVTIFVHHYSKSTLTNTSTYVYTYTFDLKKHIHYMGYICNMYNMTPARDPKLGVG